MIEVDKEAQKKARMLGRKSRLLFLEKNFLPIMFVFIWLLIYPLSRPFLSRSIYDNWYYAKSFFFAYVELSIICYCVALFVTYYSFYKTQRQIQFTSVGFFRWCRNKLRASFVGLVPFPLMCFSELSPMDEHKYASLSQKLREQAKRDGILDVDILLYPGSKFSKALNSAVIESGKKFKIVLWDSLLSGDLSDGEIASMVAHEQCHFIYGHNSQSSLLKKFILACSVLVFLLVLIGMSIIDPSTQTPLFMAIPMSLLLACLFMQVGLLLLRAISRQMEFLADAHALNITSDKKNILNAYLKGVNLSLIEFSPSSFNEFFFEDHPSTRKRLDLIAGSEITW